MRTPGHRSPTWTPEQLWESVAKIDCPTLVVRGSRSDIYAEETMDKMKTLIPECTTVTVERAGHLVAGDNPADFLVAVKELLEPPS